MPTSEQNLERRLAGEQQVFAPALGSLVRRAPVVCTEAIRVDEVARIMREQSVGSVVVVDQRSRPVGIFTEHDLVRVIADLRGTPVSAAMSRDPIALPAHTLAYEAALIMVEKRVRHVLVTEDGRLVGVISERDLFSLQRLGLAELTMEIRLAADIELLARLAAQIRRLTALLVEQGVAAEQLTLFVSVLNDRVSQRVIEVVRKRHQWERIGWCWLAFGSEGRLEQTFSSDQDNGLLFESHEGGSTGEARNTLLAFARDVNHALDACGFPLCKGNVMASNPELCLSLDEWKAKIGGWLSNSDPKALLDAAICFDFRPLSGDASLAGALREWLVPRTRARPAFLRLMATNALQGRRALGVLSDFATEDAPNAPGTIDLKLYGVRPFVDAARVYALAFGIAHTGTAERLRAVTGELRMEPSEMAAIIDAFFFIQKLRLRIQARPGNVESANRIDPGALNDFERRSLKEAFRQARKLQQRLALDYDL